MPIVTALDQLAAPSSKEAVADQLDMSAGGGTFKRKFGTAGYYGLIRKTKGASTYELTRLGERLAADPDKQTKAEGRAAVMGSGFGPVFEKFKTRTVQKNAIAVRLREDRDVLADQAERVAETLIQTGNDVGLIVDGRFKPGPMEEGQKLSKQTAGNKEADGNGRGDAEEPEGGNGAGEEPDLPHDPDPPTPPVHTPGGLQVILNIDATKLSAEQLADLVRELRRTDEATDQDDDA